VKKVLSAFLLMLCLVGGLGVGLVYRKHLADQAAGAGGGDAGGAIVAANDPNAGGAMGIPGAVATTTAPDAAAGDVAAALGGGQPASTPAQIGAPPVPASTAADLSAADVTGRSGGDAPSQPMSSSGFTPSSSDASSGSSSTSSGHHHHGAGGGGETTTFSDSAPPPVPKSQTTDDSTRFGTESGGDSEPKSTKSGRHGHTKATPAPTVVASAGGGADAEMPTIDDNSSGGNGGGSGGGTSAGGSDPFGSIDSSTPAPEPTKVAMIPKGGGELDFPAGSGGSYLKKVTQRQNGDRSIIHVDLAGSASYRVIALRNPSRVFIDFEETSVPGGSAEPIPGTVNHVKEISAKQFTSAGGLSIARVQIVLTDDKVPGASKGTADGGLDVVLGEKQDSF